MKTEIDSMSEYEAEIKRLRSKNIALEARADYAENAARCFVQELKKYETQIVNLKADFDSLQESYEFVRDCDAEHCLEINETVKQAQIDILNKAKEKLDSAPNGWAYTGYIDDLIEEIENDRI